MPTPSIVNQGRAVRHWGARTAFLHSPFRAARVTRWTSHLTCWRRHGPVASISGMVPCFWSRRPRAQRGRRWQRGQSRLSLGTTTPRSIVPSSYTGSTSTFWLFRPLVRPDIIVISRATTGVERTPMCVITTIAPIAARQGMKLVTDGITGCGSRKRDVIRACSADATTLLREGKETAQWEGG